MAPSHREMLLRRQLFTGILGCGFSQLLSLIVMMIILRRLHIAPHRRVRHLSGPPTVRPAETEIMDHGDREEDNVHEGENQGPVHVKVPPVTIFWSYITCNLYDKSSNSVRSLLKNASGEARPGRLLAIMGPSGSGKTTLLNVLAGQLAASPRIHLSGFLKFNGKPSSETSYKFAYVRQDDLFFSQLTVRETLSIATELQLPDLSSVKERNRHVNDLLWKLGLVNCADTIVGDAKVRGISGCEKKRLSLAIELLASPSVIFADEPTSGLDAFQAKHVVETLQQLAQDGHTVICSIQETRGSVYHKFDDIVLLPEGSHVYCGPSRDEPLAYFSKFGHHCPDHVNPDEVLADLMSIDYSSSESVKSSQMRIDSLVKTFSKGLSTFIYATQIAKEVLHKNEKRIGMRTVAKKKGGWWKQFWLLLRRSWMQASRDGPTNIVQATMSIATAVIFGSVFWRMGRSQTSIRDRKRLLQVVAINTAMAALTKAVGVFPKERAIVNRERAKGSYSLSPYLFSKLLVEIPRGAAFPLMFGAVLYPIARFHPTLLRFGKFCGIVTTEYFAATAMGLTVGAMVPTTEAAMTVAPPLMLFFSVFGGQYVNPENTPMIFRWIPHVSLIRWAFQGLCINEFSGLQFEHHDPFDDQTGEEALELISFGGSKRAVRGRVVVQSMILLFWYGTTYLLLQRNKPKYQQLELPPPEQEQSNPEQDDQPPLLEQAETNPEQDNQPPPLEQEDTHPEQDDHPPPLKKEESNPEQDDQPPPLEDEPLNQALERQQLQPPHALDHDKQHSKLEELNPDQSPFLFPYRRRPRSHYNLNLNPALESQQLQPPPALDRDKRHSKLEELNPDQSPFLFPYRRRPRS